MVQARSTLISKFVKCFSPPQKVDFKSCGINKPRTEGSSEPVPLTGLAHDVLLSWKKEQADKSPFLFPSPVKPDQPITTVKTAWKTTLNNAEESHFPIYHLRHVFCTRPRWVAPAARLPRALRHLRHYTTRHFPPRNYLHPTHTPKNP